VDGLSESGYCRSSDCKAMASFLVEVKWCRARQRRPTRVYDGEFCAVHFGMMIPILTQTLEMNQVLEITRMGVRRPWARQRIATRARRTPST
jgi:hypothetical protein